MHAPLPQVNPKDSQISRRVRVFAEETLRLARRAGAIIRTGFARVWIGLAPMRAGLVKLTMAGEPPKRRMRPTAFWLFSAAVCGATALSTAGLGGAITLGLDPLRNFSTPIGAGAIANFALSPQIQAVHQNNLRRRAALQGLSARAEALNRPQAELDILSDARANLEQMGKRQQDLARERSSVQRRKDEINALDAQMESGALVSIQRFAVLLAQGLRKQIQTDAALAAQLREDGWLGDLSSTIGTLRLANAPLAQLEQQLPTAQSTDQAAAIANRIADIGAAIARFRAPIPQAIDALQARTDFVTLISGIQVQLRQLQEQASDRPWIFASSERKQTWREAVARLEMLQPLLDELNNLESVALNSTRPEAIRAALLRATQIKQSLESGLTAAMPEAGVPSGPSQAVVEARKRTQQWAATAESNYRDAYERVGARLSEPVRRRRDRDRNRLDELREGMRRLYDLTVRISAADRAAQAADSESAVLQSATEAASLNQAHSQILAQINRTERDLAR